MKTQNKQSRLEKILSSVKNAGKTVLKETAKFCKDNYKVLALTTVWAIGGAGGAYALDKMVGEAKAGELRALITSNINSPAIYFDQFSVGTEGFDKDYESNINKPLNDLTPLYPIKFHPTTNEIFLSVPVSVFFIGREIKFHPEFNIILSCEVINVMLLVEVLFKFSAVS